MNRSYGLGLTDASRYFAGTLSISCWPFLPSRTNGGTTHRLPVRR